MKHTPGFARVLGFSPSACRHGVAARICCAVSAGAARPRRVHSAAAAAIALQAGAAVVGCFSSPLGMAVRESVVGAQAPIAASDDGEDGDFEGMERGHGGEERRGERWRREGDGMDSAG